MVEVRRCSQMVDGEWISSPPGILSLQILGFLPLMIQLLLKKSLFQMVLTRPLVRMGYILFFSFFFFQKSWDILGPTIFPFVEIFFTEGRLSVNLNRLDYHLSYS